VTVPDPNSDCAAPVEYAHADSGPPRRIKVVAALAALACAACCALPVVTAGGLLTAAGAALTKGMALAGAGLVMAAAAGLWWLMRRTAPESSGAGCGSGNCSC